MDAVADKGFYNGEQVKECDGANIQAYIPQPHTSRNRQKGLFTKDDFCYDKERDSYWCPQGEELTLNKGGRRITRWAEEHLLERMAERVRAHPEIIKQRKALIEHIFGTIKRSMDQGYFLLCTRNKVAAEMSLTVLAYNLKRAIKIVGVKGLIGGLVESLVCFWVWILRSIGVPSWCKRITKVVWSPVQSMIS